MQQSKTPKPSNKPVATKIAQAKAAIKSPRGRNVITFLVFLVISAVLWIVQVLNEETQRDLRCTITITHVPDSMVRITPLPEVFNVSVRARGTQLLKYLSTHSSQVEIDYRVYKSENSIHFSEAALKAFFRNQFGAGSMIQAVSPDSLCIDFTTKHGVRLPVIVDAQVSAAPQYIIVNKPQAINDSVTLYAMGGVPARIRNLHTMPINLSDLRKSQIVRVPVIVPPNSRAVPDSVDVSIEVESLISKVRSVTIQPINVPSGRKLIPVPATVDVYYMLPMSAYKDHDTDPKFKVVADYNTIPHDNNDKLALSLLDIPQGFANVYLALDSVDYIIEHQ